MKFFGTKRVIIEHEKIEGYCLNENHPVGKHKAKVFASALGINSKDAEWLINQIRDKLPECEAVTWQEDEYGIRYQVEMQIENGLKKAIISTIWLYSVPEDHLRLITCYVKQ